MSFIRKILSIMLTFQKIDKKSEIPKKIISALKVGGFKTLKDRVKWAIQRAETSREQFDDIYKSQQSEDIELTNSSKKITVVVYAETLESDLKGTIESLEKQKIQNFEVIFAVPEGFDNIQGKFDFKVHEYTTFNGLNLCEFLKTIDGEYFMLLLGGNYLAPNALGCFAHMVEKATPAVVYSDECIYDFETNHIVQYLLKPDFSELYFCNNLYIGQSVLFHIDTFLQHCQTKGSSYIDIIIFSALFRILEHTEEVKHVEKVLLLRNVHNEWKHNDVEYAHIVKQYLQKQGIMCSVTATGENNTFEIEVDNLLTPKASLVVLSDNAEMLQYCIKQIIRVTVWLDYEIIAVVDSTAFDNAVKFCSVYDNVIIVKSETSNYAEKCNIGCKKASGDVFIILHDDIFVAQKEWLKKIMYCFAFPKVGAVSPKIVTQHFGIKYAGIVSGGFGFFPIPFNGEKNEFKKNYNELVFCTREISILSATCFAVRRDAWQQIGGLNEIHTPDKFCNVELSFKIQEIGEKCVYCGQSTVIHNIENADEYDSWYDKENRTAYLYILQRWIKYLITDPYYTKPMQKRAMIHNPYEFEIYYTEPQSKIKKKEKPKNILIISHELSMTGAPIALQYAVKAFIKNGDNPVVLSPKDGLLREEFVNEGVPVIIDSSIYALREWMRFAQNFDVIVVNTLVQYLNIVELCKTNIPVLWWVHEAREGYELYMKPLIPKQISSNIHVYTAGIYAKNVLLDYRQTYNPDILLYGLPDFAKNLNSEYCYKLDNIENKTVFISVGTIERRKGQDILVKAIRRLSKEQLKKCQFVFIGKKVSDGIYANIQELKHEFPQNITIIDSVKRHEIMDIYRQSTCIICSSRDDPMPVFMTEGMMLSKICICSENTGTATLIENGVNGFVYHKNSDSELADKIKYVIENQHRVEQLKKASRATYEKYFAMDVFDTNLLGIIDKISAEK